MRQVHYFIGSAYYVEHESRYLENGYSKKKVRKHFFVNNYIIYNFFLIYVCDKTYRLRKKRKKNDAFSFFFE